MITYEFISRKDTVKIDRTMRQLWLLGIHGDGYMRDTLRGWWNCGDNVAVSGMTGQFNIVLARVDGMIAGAILHEVGPYTVDTYVTHGYRRMGIASMMIDVLRANIGDRKVLCGWTGMTDGGWTEFFNKKHICHLGFPLVKADIEKHGDRDTAWNAMAKSAKLKTSAAYRKSKAHATC